MTNPSTDPLSTPPMDSTYDLSAKTDDNLTESTIDDVTNAILSDSKCLPLLPPDEKTSTISTLMKTSSSSLSSSRKNPQMQKQTFSSPPPQAFQSLPLASGTIHPPSFTSPIKPEKQFDVEEEEEEEEEKEEEEEEETTKTKDAIVKEDEENAFNETSRIDKTNNENIQVSFKSVPKKEQPNVQSYGKVKGIDEYLPKTSDDNEFEVIADKEENKERAKAPEDVHYQRVDKTEDYAAAVTPTTGNITSDDGNEVAKEANIGFVDTENNNAPSNLTRRNSESTILVSNESKEFQDGGVELLKGNKNQLNEDNESITSSVANSNPRSLLPRSLDLSSRYESDGFRQRTLRGRRFVDISSGSGAASIISSQESKSIESRERRIENDLSRRRHLGMLLDRHQHQIKTRRRNNVTNNDEPWWQNDEDDSSIEKGSSMDKISILSADSSNKGPMSINSTSDRSSVFPSKSVLTNDFRTSSITSSKRKSSITSGDSIQDLKNRKNNDSLFENFDKTWESFHEVTDAGGSNKTVSLDTPIAREQICFASMVLVLLQHIPKKSPDTETYWSKSVPIEIVKLFWEEVIFEDKDDNSDGKCIKLRLDGDLKSTTEKIADTLLNKLRYVSIDDVESNSNPDDENSSMRIKLSHDVYADYSKHILKKYNLLPGNCINRWNAKFVALLRYMLDSHCDDTIKSSSMKSNQVLIYASTHIPKLVLLSIHPETCQRDDIELESKDQDILLHQKERFDYFILLMKDSKFLLQRMKILGACLQPNEKKGASNDEVKRRFQSESYFDRVALDILKPTKVHIEDLESINIVLSMMPKELFVGDDGAILDSTDTVMSQYKAWKELCLKLLQQEDLINTPQLDDVAVFDRSRSASGPIIQASKHAQQSLPKCSRLQPGEYELRIAGPIASITKTQANDINKENPRRSRHQESKERSSANMRLSHLLQIDPAHLYHYLSIGKSIYLLGESIFEATFYSSDNSTSSDGLKSLLGPSPNATSLSFISSSIDVYTQLTHLMSFILSNDIGDVDEDDLIDMGYRYERETGNMDPSLRMRRFLQDRTEARIMFEKLNILCAESWLALGNYLLFGVAEGYSDAIEAAGLHIINRLESSDVKDVDPLHTMEGIEEKLDEDVRERPIQPQHLSQFQSKTLLCFQMALGVLLHYQECVQEQNVAFKAELTSVVVHARNLRASIIHAVGVHFYEQVSDYERAKVYLDSSLASRRLLLRLIQREDPDDRGSLSGSSMNRGYKRRYQSHSRRPNTRQKRKTKPLETESAKKSYIDVLLNFQMNRKRQIALIEKGLSTTLEFSALASHCLLDYDASLSSFQEALILRALHSGKESLEVASLQYNMGVVHDDLAQHEASLGRYGESLRVRYSLLEKLREKILFEPPFNSSVLVFIDLEASVILTLTCMGNVYRALNDATNAIGCLMKAIELLKDKLKRGATKRNSGLYQFADGDLGFGKGMMMGVPMPKTILNELKGDEQVSKIDKLESENPIAGSNVNDEDEALRREISSMYNTIVGLVQERADQRSILRVGAKSGYTSSASSYTSGSFSKSTRNKNAQSKKGLDASSDNDSIHLDSAFNLGLLSLHFNDQKNALNYFEDALRTLWTTFSGESSGESSDSDYSKSSASRSSSRTRQKKVYFEGQVEEGALYHALAVAHASLSDHERAVRCYVTALRYYRRRFGLECIIVAGALYDCAFSYWKLGDNDRAEDFWADCLKILLCGGENAEKKESISSIHDLHVARTLYNLAAAKLCKGEYDDLYVSTCLNDAISIFRRLCDEDCRKFFVEIGHCSYYLGYLHYLKSHDTPILHDLNTAESNQNNSSAPISTSKEVQLKNALAFIDDALSNYLTDSGNMDIGLEQVEVGQKLQHPMQAHIAHLSAWIHDSLGMITQAQWHYKTAIRLLNKVYSPQNLYSASAMHSLANLYMLLGNSKEALNYYKDALVVRTQLLGSEHAAVADTLFQMAGIIGGTEHYGKAVSLFSHCLRIRILTEGNDGDSVAETLLNLAFLHDKNGHCRKAQECLEGALKVRRSRLQSIIQSCIASFEKPVESESNDTEDCIQSETRSEHTKLAYIMHNLGNVLLKLGDINEAMKCFNEALDIRRKLIGIDDGGFAMFVARNDSESVLELNRDVLSQMADTLHNLGGVYETKEMQQKALACYNLSLIIKRSISKEKQVAFSLDDQIKSCNTLSSAFTLLRIGAIHNELQNYDVSLSYYKSALNIQKQHLGRDHISVAQTLVDMGLILRRQMENPVDIVSDVTQLEQRANKYFSEALRISKLRHGADHVSVAGIMYHIGSMHAEGGNYILAINHYEHAAKVYGREYARTLFKSLFNMTAIQRNKYDFIVDNDHGLFHPTTLRNNLLPVESNTSVVLSRGMARSPTRVTEIDRDSYLRASLALAEVAAKSGFIWMPGNSFQSLVLRILHFISTNGVDPVRDTLHERITYLMNTFSKASTHAVVTVNDAPQTNFLYLIND